MVQRKMNKRRFTSRLASALAVLLMLLTLAAGCGPGDELTDLGGEAPAASEAVPTMPAARFDQPTPVTDLEEASEADRQADEEEAAEEPDIAMGEFVYGNRCAECHGEGAAGTDQASTLVGLTLSENEFEDLIRTGGELGPDHLFGSTKISPDGLKAVYAYLISLE
ncbi:MAG: cytochrome c [Caldilineaceae bacterium SB0668_bin_21]|nr:cytochrome c [Caldilineaceae bacterium SB0668_bin_21]MYC20814.1 cytochrome c [Caldilineaceae bacterium SB0662_bin_25]